MSDSIQISGESNVRAASVLALRSALKLETKGLKKHGRSARSIACELLGLNPNLKSKSVYEKLNAYVVQQLGQEFDRPLS